MFLYGTGVFDFRVKRSAASLAKAGHRVTLIGLSSRDDPDQEETSWGRIIRVGGRDTRRIVDELNPQRRGARRFFRLRQLMWLARYVQTYRSWHAQAVRAGIAASREASQVVWHGHDLTGLVPAASAQARRGGSLVYDSHELYLESGSLPHLPGLARRMLFFYEGRLARRAHAVITVNGSIARELSTRYAIPYPVVVMNCPPLELKPSAYAASPLRAALSVGRDRILVIHGALTPSKGVLETAAALRQLPADCKLALLGVGPLAVGLRELSQSGELRGRILIHPPVPQDALLAWLSGADLAIIAFAPGSLNQQYATPNRLFESLAAGVPVVVSDFPELRRIVEGIDAGAVCDPTNPSSIADAVRRLLEEPLAARMERRARCRKAVETTYNWDRQSQGLLGIYARLRLGSGA